MATSSTPPCVIEKSVGVYKVTFNGLTWIELLGLRNALKQLADAGSEHARGMLNNLTEAAEEGNLKVTIFSQRDVNGH